MKQQKQTAAMRHPFKLEFSCLLLFFQSAKSPSHSLEYGPGPSLSESYSKELLNIFKKYISL